MRGPECLPGRRRHPDHRYSSATGRRRPFRLRRFRARREKLDTNSGCRLGARATIRVSGGWSATGSVVELLHEKRPQIKSEAPNTPNGLRGTCTCIASSSPSLLRGDRTLRAPLLRCSHLARTGSAPWPIRPKQAKETARRHQGRPLRAALRCASWAGGGHGFRSISSKNTTQSSSVLHQGRITKFTEESASRHQFDQRGPDPSRIFWRVKSRDGSGSRRSDSSIPEPGSVSIARPCGCPRRSWRSALPAASRGLGRCSCRTSRTRAERRDSPTGRS